MVGIVSKAEELYSNIKAELNRRVSGVNFPHNLNDLISEIDGITDPKKVNDKSRRVLLDQIRLLHSECKKYQEGTEKLLEIDWKERKRLLGFRVATAIGIAGVVLGTGVIAKWLEIPLPLLRIAT